MNYEEIMVFLQNESQRIIPGSDVFCEGDESEDFDSHSAQAEDLQFIIMSNPKDSSENVDYAIFCPSPCNNDSNVLREYLRRQVLTELQPPESQEFDKVLLLEQNSTTGAQTDLKNGALLIPTNSDEFKRVCVIDSCDSCVKVSFVVIESGNQYVHRGYAIVELDEGEFIGEYDNKTSGLVWMDRIGSLSQMYDSPLAVADSNKEVLFELPKGIEYRGENVWAHQHLPQAGMKIGEMWIPVMKPWLLASVETLPSEIASEVYLMKSLIM